MFLVHNTPTKHGSNVCFAIAGTYIMFFAVSLEVINFNRFHSDIAVNCQRN